MRLWPTRSARRSGTTLFLWAEARGGGALRVTVAGPFAQPMVANLCETYRACWSDMDSRDSTLGGGIQGADRDTSTPLEGR